MNLTPQERKALQSRYAPQRTIVRWEVVQFGKVVYESPSPALCEHHIKQFNLVGVYKKAVYGNRVRNI